MQVERDCYWKSYYHNLAVSGNNWLDYSNPAVQLQSLALCLEAAGSVLGQVCADLGCGRGQIAKMLAALGSRSVVGVDFVDALITDNKIHYPGIDWRCGDILDTSFVTTLPQFDRIFMIEMLQYVDMATIIPLIWKILRPGGRIVCMVPNKDCPIIKEVAHRFGDRYLAFAPNLLPGLANRLDDLEDWSCRGLTFRKEQNLLAYKVGEWSKRLDWERPPNRLNVVFLKGNKQQ